MTDRKDRKNQDVLTRLLEKLRAGEMVTRDQLLRWGSTNPASHIALARKKGEFILYIRNRKEAFWVCPKHAFRNGIDWQKRAFGAEMRGR